MEWEIWYICKYVILMTIYLMMAAFDDVTALLLIVLDAAADVVPVF